MTKGWKSKSIAAGAVIATSLSFAGTAYAKGSWKPSTGLSGMSPGAFSLVCREIYGGTPTFESGVWICEMPDGRVVACDVDTDTTSKNCRTYTPAMRKAGSVQQEYIGPTSFSR